MERCKRFCLLQICSKIPTLKSFKLKTVFPLGARNVYHQLFMSSLLMDLKYKKLFAIQFAKVRYLVPVAIYCINKSIKVYYFNMQTQSLTLEVNN